MVATTQDAVLAVNHPSVSKCRLCEAQKGPKGESEGVCAACLARLGGISEVPSSVCTVVTGWADTLTDRIESEVQWLAKAELRLKAEADQMICQSSQW